MERRRVWRTVQRLLRVLAFLVLALALLLIGAYLLRGPLFGRLLADRIELELGKALGGRFSVMRVEGSYLFDLAVVGLRTEEPPPGPLRRLDWSRAVVEYDLRKLIAGDLGGISVVLVSNAEVEVDLTREEGGAAGAEEVEIPRYLPRIEVYGNILVVSSAGEVRAEGLSVNTIGVDRFGVGAREIRLPEPFGPGAPFAGTLARTGPLAFELTSETPVAGVTPVRVAYDGVLDAQLRVGPSPAELRLAGGEARFSSAALDLTRLPAWVYPEGAERPREATISLDARVRSFEPLVVEATAGAERVLWRDLDLRDVRLEAAFDDGRVTVRSVHAEGHGAAVDARDVVVEPELPWFVGDVGEAVVRVDDLRAFEPSLDRPLRLSLTAHRAGTQGIAVEEARVEGESILLEGRGEVALPDDPARWQEAGIQASYTGTLRDFASGAYAFSGEVRVSGAVSGTVARPDATARVEGDGLLVEGRKVEHATVDLHLAPPMLEIRDFRVEGEAGTARARGAIDLDAGALTDATYELDISDLGAFLRLFPGAPEIDGSLSGQGRLAADENGIAGTAEIAAAGLVADGREIGSVDLKVHASGGEITVERADAKGPWGSGSVRGVARPGDRWARVEALGFDAGSLKGELNRPFRLSWTGGEVSAAPLDVNVFGGRVRGTATLHDGERLEASLQGEEIDLSLLDGRFAGRASVELHADGDRYEIEATAPAAEYEGRAAIVRLKARSGLDGIVVEKILLDAGEKLTVEGSATLPWRFDGETFARVETVEPRLNLEARAQRFAAGGFVIGEAVASVRGEGRDFRSNVRLRDVSVDGFAVRGETLVSVNASSGRLQATAALEQCDLGEAEAGISADRGFDWTDPVDVREALEAARLDGEIELRLPDLGAVRRFVPGLEELKGTADGKVALRGPLTAPTIDGSLHLVGVEAKAKDVPRLTDGRGELSFDGTTLRITGVEGKLGHAPVGLTGTVELGSGAPLLDLRITGKNALLVAQHDLRVRADLDVTVEGSADALEVGGNVVVADVLYSRARSLLAGASQPSASSGGPLFSIRDAPLRTATLNLLITADETIRVRTPNIAGNISCDLRVRGTGEAPAPEGRIYFRDLLIEEQPIAAIKVDRGEIRFPPGEPFDPRIDLAAHTRLKGYDIEVTLDGYVSNAQLHVSSRPYLSQEDAILLLGTGFTREELESEGISRAAFGKLAAFLGGRLVASLSGPRDPDERSFLDRFRFTVGKEVSRSGEDTIEGEFEASERLFLRVERDRFDEYNGGIVWRIRFK